ncbi:BLOC-1-related complex subunit 5-like [Pecten maximus]|uniref:BLOC-1-related complex subunit 5-like n=1 Tax=Pecten maximus TaxID=6579 RepID=UPI001458CA8B|nr:BLOC-1-related complex subunit 5-like [Pecten maximus]
MGSEQSTQPPAGAPGSNIKSQRDEDIPYTSFSISKPIDGEPMRHSPRNVGGRPRSSTKDGKEDTPKHKIVVVADGNVSPKDKDPELTKLEAIPVFYPIMRGSLNIPTSSRDPDILDKLDHQQILLLCIRYQEHLRQLSEAVAFDQNALCVRIKEIDCAINMLVKLMSDRQKKYHKYAEQFTRASETLTVLNRVKDSVDNIIPKMERLNQLLPEGEQLEPFSIYMNTPTNTAPSK